MRALLLMIAVAAVSLGLGSCSQQVRPDLRRLYETQPSDVFQPPVIVVHGALGSRLRQPDAGVEAWPGRLIQILFGTYTHLKLDIDPATLAPLPSPYKPLGVNRGLLGRDYYGRILRVLDDVGGYRLTTPGTAAKPGERHCYIFLYDWRQDIVETSRRLDALIEQVRRDFGVPSLQVDMVAHSLGGLVARYFVRYGTEDVLADDTMPSPDSAAGPVRRLILLGVPNFGSAQAFRVLDRGYPIGLGSIPPEATATFPSTFQVLPHSVADNFINAEGKPVSVDVFDLSFWKDARLSVFNPSVTDRIRERFDSDADADSYLALLEVYFEKQLGRARRLARALSLPPASFAPGPVVFGADCIPTPTRMVIEERDGDTRVHLQPHEVHTRRTGVDYARIMLKPGDGTVTKASLLARPVSMLPSPRREQHFFPMSHALFLCDEHTQLTGNIHFQDNLLNTLLSADQAVALPAGLPESP